MPLHKSSWLILAAIVVVAAFLYAFLSSNAEKELPGQVDSYEEYVAEWEEPSTEYWDPIDVDPSNPGFGVYVGADGIQTYVVDETGAVWDEGVGDGKVMGKVEQREGKQVVVDKGGKAVAELNPSTGRITVY